MPPGFGQLVRLGKVCVTRTISRGGWSSLAVLCTAFIPSASKRHIAEALVPQVESVTQATQDIVMQLRTICDSVLYAYLSKVADTTEKQHYLGLSCTVFGAITLPHSDGLDTFLDNLHKLEVLDLHLSLFQPHALRPFLVTINPHFCLSLYILEFRSDPERSKEFHKGDLFDAFIATRYMRFLRTPSNSR